jgi:ribosome maturation factor RimP
MKAGLSCLALFVSLVAVTGVSAQDKVTVGDVVWAEFKPNFWFHGKIAKVDGKDFRIAFDDGDEAVVDGSKIALDRAPKKDMVKVETRVLAKFKQGRFYPGKIAKIDGEHYDIKFDDSDADTVALDDLRLIGVTAPEKVTVEKVTVGDVVWAEFKPNFWFHGKIAKVDGKDLHIAFDDGDKAVVDGSKIALDRAPKKDMVKVDTRVLAKFKQGRFYPGKIAKIDGERYEIKFDDSDVDTVALDDLRLIGQ